MSVVDFPAPDCLDLEDGGALIITKLAAGRWAIDRLSRSHDSLALEPGIYKSKRKAAAAMREIARRHAR
jgi:hypothetical protein